ncbi:BMP family ABC transporter substrate-binding protein [Halalkalibacterium ligniniphilum]|uniref:BMP family ABC transporter substrate-binding protein n=1 Tax=Halalkalibacterium ligniniphilum TaxID=1134413 RepID=UPI00034D7C32|nr:BMP family ABC transporter substrate-binding protein [Halalkalibacterium ligniniphilum]
MMLRLMSVLLLLFFLIGCSDSSSNPSLKSVGLLVENTIDDQGWNSKGYQGLLNIHANLNVDVFLEEGIDNESKARAAIEKFVKEDVNLIFGHGHVFASYFSELGSDFPDVHFVSFNGDVTGDNVTSLQFDGYAMGYFGGMVAGEMSQTNKVGVIAAFPWQPEVQGFVDGASYLDKAIAYVEYVGDWSDVDKAMHLHDKLKAKGVDVFYPAGDGYHIQVIEEIKRDGDFAIGYVGDQSDLGEATVLTSTVQHVDSLYELVAERFQNGELEAGNLSYDFKDGVISLGAFSTVVPETVQEQVEGAIATYVGTDRLPHQTE